MIEFDAAVFKVQTMVDGGIRVTLDLPETAIQQMAELAVCQRVGAAIHFEAEPLLNKRNKSGTAKRDHKQSKWQTAEEPGANRSLAPGTGEDV